MIISFNRSSWNKIRFTPFEYLDSEISTYSQECHQCHTQNLNPLPERNLAIEIHYSHFPTNYPLHRAFEKPPSKGPLEHFLKGNLQLKFLPFNLFAEWQREFTDRLRARNITLIKYHTEFNFADNDHRNWTQSHKNLLSPILCYVKSVFLLTVSRL